MKAPFEAGITIEDLTVVRGGHMALTDVTFEVGPGVLMGVLGPNGAGKSTLFDAIARVLPITQGTVDWFAFIADGSGTIVDHYDKSMVGTDIKDLLGTDVFEATAEGNWVTTEDVRVWVVSDGGMTFASGWHRGHDESN